MHYISFVFLVPVTAAMNQHDFLLMKGNPDFHMDQMAVSSTKIVGNLFAIRFEIDGDIQ